MIILMLRFLNHFVNLIPVFFLLFCRPDGPGEFRLLVFIDAAGIKMISYIDTIKIIPFRDKECAADEPGKKTAGQPHFYR